MQLKAFKEFFDTMHDVDFPYLVMRNFAQLPYGFEDGHNDVDILVYDFKHFQEIFPDCLPVHPEPRVQHKLKIGENNVYIDVRSVGDGYYPTSFQLNMLETREWDEKGFYKPNAVHFRLGLSYHVAHHKQVNSYEKYLGNATVEELLKSLQKSSIGYVEPKDPTVGRFNQYWKGATSVVTKKDGKVVKEQNSWNEFNLIDNEYRILHNINSTHFPQVWKKEKAIEIEDCGDSLSVNNLPKNWKRQLGEIVQELKDNNIQHRDIKPDNLMIKNEVIKLIDFGWARYYGEMDSAPSCLGFPYKPSDGWNDNFSMRKVIKEFEYKKEEILI